MRPRKTAVADDEDCLYELTTTEVLRSQLTPAKLDLSQILKKGYMWEIERVLRGNSGLVETQQGCQHYRLGLNPTPT